jgi:hypothetical protein
VDDAGADSADGDAGSAAPLVQRGLIGAVRLPREGERPTRIHPHEDVVGAVVQDRRSLMYALGANPEPILLTYRGGGPASDLVERVASSVGAGLDGSGDAAGDGPGGAVAGIGGEDAPERTAQATPPLLIEARTADGIRHRLWAVTDAADIEVVAADLAQRQALIADGHHRYAAYRELARLGRPGSEYGLALLVDSERHPLRVRGIHRWLPDLPTGHALHEAAKWFTVRPVEGGYRAALGALEELPAERIGFAVVDGHKAWLLSDPDERLLARHVPADRPEAWRRLDATVLHHALAGAVWSVPDTAEHIRYDHDPRSAVAEAYRHSGIAVLLRPVAESAVLELAAAGCMMPRKSTSFSPKPATGLVLRLLDETEEA